MGMTFHGTTNATSTAVSLLIFLLAASSMSSSASACHPPDAVLADVVFDDDANGADDRVDDDDDADRRRRRATASSRETLVRWRSLLSSSSSHRTAPASSSFDYAAGLRPLDLVLVDEDDTGHDDDENIRRTTPRAYQRGGNGYLEPYDFFNYQRAEERERSGTAGEEDANDDISVHIASSSSTTDVRLSGRDGRLDDVDDDIRHRTSDRVGFTNLDMRRGVGDSAYDEDDDKEVDGEEGGKRDQEGGEEEREEEERRGLLRGTNLDYRSSHSENFVNVHDEKRSSSHAEQFASSSSSSSSQRKKREADDGTILPRPREESGIVVDDDVVPPVVRATFPPPGTAIGSRQSFGALVSDDGVDVGMRGEGSGVDRACVQFRDGSGTRSACLPLHNVGAHADVTSDDECARAENRNLPDCSRYYSSSSSSSSSSSLASAFVDAANDDAESSATPQRSDIWERTFDGFGPYAGQTWRYRIQSHDMGGNRVVTRWTRFTIDAMAAERTTTTTTTAATTITSVVTDTTTTSTTASTTSSRETTKLLTEVKDNNWPYGGRLGCADPFILCLLPCRLRRRPFLYVSFHFFS